MLRFPDRVEAAHVAMALHGKSDEELGRALRLFRETCRRDRIDDELVAVAFALVREMSYRVLGMRHYNVQIMAGWALMHGMVAEMATGEGKTLVAALPACTAALAGIPVHVITANDYLAERDALLLKPLYQAMGLSVGHVVHGMAPREKQYAYQCDVVYCANKEIVFDYLRDGIAAGKKHGHIREKIKTLSAKGKTSRRIMRGLHFAIVDEADDILIDEARTPLVITGQEVAEVDPQDIRHAMELSEKMEDGDDFRVNHQDMTVELTGQGEARIERWAEAIGRSWKNRAWGEGLVRQALSAAHIFHRDEQYIIRQNKIVIVDGHTGRVMADRSWGRGLHQMIEYKEGCDMTASRVTRSRISYQQFFRRYIHLGGMTGTAREVRRELWAVYGLPFVRVPTHRKIIRTRLPSAVFVTREEKLEAISRKVHEMNDTGRPVLVGTKTVLESESLSNRLKRDGVDHRVLNARQNMEEAKIITMAGERGGVTIATNMAGRGTDILLGDGVRDIGGLYVIVSECHDAKRIDRQLVGRCGRQGDPGSFEYVLSLEDELFRLVSWAGMLQGVLAGMLRLNSYCGGWAGFAFFRLLQHVVTRSQYRMRCEVLKQDHKLGDILAFSGERE